MRAAVAEIRLQRRNFGAKAAQRTREERIETLNSMSRPIRGGCESFWPKRASRFPGSKSISRKLDHKSETFATLNPSRRFRCSSSTTERLKRVGRHLPVCRGAPPGAESVRRAPRLNAPRSKCGSGARNGICCFRSPRCSGHPPAHGGDGAASGRRLGGGESPARAAQFRIIDEALAHRDYLAGDRFTVADITGFVALDFMRPARLTIPLELTHLTRWRERLAARPSASA